MSRLTLGRAAAVAALVACIVYSNALLNGWAMDDSGVVRENPAAHSVAAAWEGRFSPYWPMVEGVSAGLWRPAITMSYAVDWTLSGGREWWFHAHNVLLHALVTALVVLVIAAWLPPPAALAAGLVFAVHPVHVEAVSNVVGRAEIQAALFILLAVVAFRRARFAGSVAGSRAWFAGTVAATLLALLSKEHGAVTVTVLALDALLLKGPQGRLVVRRLLLIAAITVAWVLVWQAVAGGWVRPSTATSLRYLSPGQRIATVLPVYLEVVRLLTWPMVLSHDYNPQLIPQRTEFTAFALMGFLTAGAVVVLGLACLKKAPVVSFGILVAVLSYAPSSNLIFPAGTILGERLLYLAVLAPACVAGWLMMRFRGWQWALPALSIVLLAYGARTVTRTPFWKDSLTVVIDGLVQHPEVFRVHMELGHMLMQAGDSARALSEYLVAGEIFGRDPFVAMWSVPLALELERPRVALREAQRVWPLAPHHPAVNGVLAGAYRANGQWDSALAVAREGVQRAPQSRTAALVYQELLRARDEPPWRIALAEARLHWRRGHFTSATGALAAADTLIGDAASLDGVCWEIADLRLAIRALVPELEQAAQEAARREGQPCQIGDADPLRPAGGLAN